jgi:hypothetical protein
MSPTAELRWVRRIDPSYTMREVKVLQQKWVQHHIPSGKTEAPSEWRDVPTVFDAQQGGFGSTGA